MTGGFSSEKEALNKVEGMNIWPFLLNLLVQHFMPKKYYKQRHMQTCHLWNMIGAIPDVLIVIS